MSLQSKETSLSGILNFLAMDRSSMSSEVVNNEDSLFDETLVPSSSDEVKLTMSQCLVLPPSSALDSDQRPWISEFWQSQYTSLDSNIYKFLIEIVNDQKENIMMLMNQDSHNQHQNEELSSNSSLSQPTALNLSLLEEKLRISPQKKIWLKISTLDDYDVLSFLEEFSRFICHLVISNQKPKEGDFLQFLKTANFSHLESLTISNEIFVNCNVPLSEDNDKDSIIPGSLNQLKVLRFYTPRENLNISLSFIPHFKLLVRLATNIMKIYGFPLKFYSTVLKQLEAVNMKIPAIKSVFISSPPHITGKEYFTEIQSLIKNAAKLEELNISLFFKDDEGKRKIKLFLYNEILNRSQSTLKKLTIGLSEKFGFLQRLPYSLDEFIKYPRLQHLETLHLLIKTKNCHSQVPEFFFHSEFNLNEVFPYITTLEITYGDGDLPPMKNCPNLSHYLNSHFPLNVFIPGETLRTVQRLKLTNFIPGELLYHLGTALFHQITSLTLKSTPKMLNLILTDIFQICPDLETLRLEIDMKNESCMENLDSAMTGMADERCKSMRMRINFGAYQGLKARDMKQVCIRPGIYTLKQLKLLQIVFQGQTIPAQPIFSYLSGVFAFGMMPQGTIIIGFSTTCTAQFIHGIYSTLEPITPYVTIEM